MESFKGSFLKRILWVLIIAMAMTFPFVSIWASTLNQKDINLWKMWINLAINGYAEPMPRSPGEVRPWWQYWE